MVSPKCFLSCVQFSITPSLNQISINPRRRSSYHTPPIQATGSSDKCWDSDEERERALDSKWLEKAGSVFEGSSSDRTAHGGGGVEGWYGSALIPVVDVSANCVRLNEPDTTVEVRFFSPSNFFFFFFFKRSGTQAVSGGNRD